MGKRKEGEKKKKNQREEDWRLWGKIQKRYIFPQHVRWFVEKISFWKSRGWGGRIWCLGKFIPLQYAIVHQGSKTLKWMFMCCSWYAALLPGELVHQDRTKVQVTTRRNTFQKTWRNLSNQNVKPELIKSKSYYLNFKHIM